MNLTQVFSLQSDAPPPTARTSSLHRLRLSLPGGIEPVNLSNVPTAHTEIEIELTKTVFFLQQQNLKLIRTLEGMAQRRPR